MALNSTPIHLSSFLLERNRWNGKGPSLLVSDWIEPIAEAGFRGIEIWGPHFLFSSRSEWETIREKSQEADIPIVFLYAQVPLDRSDKSARQRDSLIEAADYFGVPGLKISLAHEVGVEEKLSFLEKWTRDLPRDLQIVRTFEEHPPQPGEIAASRKRLGAAFRYSINPFECPQGALEGLLREAGDLLVNLTVKARREGKYAALRDIEETADIVALTRRLDFKGSWTLEATAGVGEPGEDIELLFDEAEEDLNFLVTALSRK
jgi:hypothetical protein